MTVFQIIILIFALFVLIRVGFRYKHGDITRREWAFWTVLWLLAGIAAALPQTTDRLATGLGVATGRGVDLVVYSAIPILFYIVFRLYTKLDSMERDMTAIVREIALKKNDTTNSQE